MRKRVLITGAAGFLGRHVSKAFKESGALTCGIGHGDLGREELKSWGLDEWFQADVTLGNLVATGREFDVIVHCAGSGSVSFSLQEPMADFQRTVESTLAVLEFMRLKNPEAHLIYPSSPAVQGDGDGKPLRETDPCKPVSPYGVHKKISEDLCRSYEASFGLQSTVVRFFSIYGEGLKKQLLWDAANKLLQNGREACFWGTGDEVRDWIHVEDAASLALFLSGASCCPSLVNGGSGRPHTISEILLLLRRFLGVSSSISFNNRTRKGDPRYYCADTSLLNSLSWEPFVSLEDGLFRYAEWVRGQI